MSTAAAPILSRLVVASVVLALVAGVVRADDLLYLPDNCVLLGRANLEKLRGSPFGKESVAKVPGLHQKIDRDLKRHGFAPEKVACVASGAVLNNNRETGITIYTLVEPAKAAAIMEHKMKGRIIDPQNPEAFEEIKVGDVTIYHLVSGGANRFARDAFCIPEKNIVLFARNAETLQAVLARKKSPNVTSQMAEAIKSIPKDEGVTVLLDIEGMGDQGQKMKEQMNRQLPGVGDLMFTGKLVHLSLTAGDALTVKTAAVCADKTQADELKKSAEKTIADLKTLLKSAAMPADVSKALTAGLDGTKLSTSGARAEAVSVTDSSVAMPVLSMLFRPIAEPPVEKKVIETKDKAIDR